MNGVSETINDEAKEQECRFLSKSLGTLGVSYYTKFVSMQKSNKRW